jgi:GT2 family glycosyltransferase
MTVTVPAYTKIDRVSVVVPSYDRRDDVMRCLTSIASSKPLPPGGIEVIVVNDGYDDGFVEQLSRSMPPSEGVLIRVRPTQRMLVSASRNLGAVSATGDYLLFVDDDNELEPGAVYHLWRALASWDDAYMVAPLMFYGSRPDLLWCAGLRRSPFLMRTLWRRQLPTPAPVRLRSEDFPNCFMVRRSEFNAVGGFDQEHFPVAYEESDLARRLQRLHSGDAYCVPSSRTRHYIGMDRSRRFHLTSPASSYYHARSRRRFIKAYGSLTQRCLYATFGRWLYGAAYCFAALSSAPHERWTLLSAHLRGAFGLAPPRAVQRLNATTPSQLEAAADGQGR